MEPFDTKIRDVIRRFHYPMWFVIRNEDVKCTCLHSSSKQPNPGCKKCLGTGRQVTIRRILAAHQPGDISYRGTGLGQNERDAVGNYYTLQDVKAKANDIIVDGEDIDIIQMGYAEHSNKSEVVYYKYKTSPMKFNRKKFMESFNAAISKGG